MTRHVVHVGDELLIEDTGGQLFKITKLDLYFGRPAELTVKHASYEIPSIDTILHRETAGKQSERTEESHTMRLARPEADAYYCEECSEITNAYVEWPCSRERFAKDLLQRAQKEAAWEPIRKVEMFKVEVRTPVENSISWASRLKKGLKRPR